MTEATNSGPKLKDFACRRPEDCSNIDGTYCDADLGFCLCKPDYPVTDTNHCYKGMYYVMYVAHILKLGQWKFILNF